MNIELLGAFIVGVASLSLLQILVAMYRKWRSAKPTPAEVAQWGRKFEAAGVRVTPQSVKTGGLPGLRLEREGILAALRLCRCELKAIRAAEVKAGYGDAFGELDLKYAEFLDYTQRLQDVDRDIEEYPR